MDDLLKNTILGLSPMDGVTDASYRLMVNTYGKPDINYTEFVHVMGMCRGSERLYQDFIFDDIERPILGQIFGAEPEYFYHASKIICELGFDGVDINMGCPAKTVTEKGAGAGLIRTPDLAREIIRQTKKGVIDWYETGELTGISDDIKLRIKNMNEQRRKNAELRKHPFSLYSKGSERQLVPVTVKTRVGYDREVVSEWIPILSEEAPLWIALHGRTLKQMYQGQADWDTLAKAVTTTKTPVLVNGDIKNRADIAKVLDHTQAAGALIGRGTYGNPWFFKDLNRLKHDGDTTDYAATPQEKISVMLEHAKLHEESKGERAFLQMRKNIGWYLSGFDGAAELRKELITVSSYQELKSGIESIAKHLIQ